MKVTPNTAGTRKVIENARKSFESVTGKKVKNATVADIEQWMNSLRSMGRATSTCVTYLTYVKQLAKLKEIEMPGMKRTVTQTRILSDAEIKQMLGVITGQTHALLASLLLNGTSVLGWQWGDLTDPTLDISIAAKMILVNEAGRRGKDITPLLSFGRKAHWANDAERVIDFDEIIFPQSTHYINRRLKAIAKRSGIGEQNVNITVIKNACRRLWAEYKTAERITQVLEIKTMALPSIVLPAKRIAPVSVQSKRDTRLHGIGRRSQLMKPA